MSRATTSPSATRIDRRTALGALATLAAGACAPRTPIPPPSFDTAAERYVRAALQLAQHDPRLVDGWSGPADWRPGPRVPVAGLVAELEALALEVADLRVAGGDDARRGRYLAGQVQALHLAGRRLLGDSAPLADEAQRAYGRTMPAVDAPLVIGALDALNERLPGSGALGPRAQAFRRQMIVPADRVEAVARAAFEACRDRTRAAMTLPEGEAATLAFVQGTTWDAWCRYDGGLRSTIEVNQAGEATVSRLCWLMAHEAYPGHHVQHVVIDHALVQGRGWQELALQPAFGPHLLMAEGAAEWGVERVLPDPEREVLYADVLLPAAGLSPDLALDIVALERLSLDLEMAVVSLAADYLDGKANAETTIDLLTRESVVADPRAFVHFAEQQRTRLYAYPVGRQLVLERLGAPAAPGTWARLQTFYEQGLVP
ncbi:MAG: hypothetical protein ACLGHP_01405 [Vicinamibacteria bacterium]